MVGIGWWLDYMILVRVISKFNDSMILCFSLPTPFFLSGITCFNWCVALFAILDWDFRQPLGNLFFTLLLCSMQYCYLSAWWNYQNPSCAWIAFFWGMTKPKNKLSSTHNTLQLKMGSQHMHMQPEAAWININRKSLIYYLLCTTVLYKCVPICLCF